MVKKIAGGCSKRAEKLIWKFLKKTKLLELKVVIAKSRADPKFFSRTAFPLETGWTEMVLRIYQSLSNFSAYLASSSLLCSPSCWGFPSSSGTLTHIAAVFTR